MEYDFSGYATRNDLRCSDGRIIRQDAFAENDGQTVPLVWQHVHSDPTNVLGHALLENREDGVYAYCKLNGTESGNNARELVRHGDIDSLSIFATKLTQNGPNVMHGDIKEVSLVLSGANPGAFIDNLCIAHADGSYVDIDDEAVITSGEPIEYLAHGGYGYDYDPYLYHEDDDYDDEDDDEDDDDGETIGEIFDTLSEKQKNVVYAIIGQALHDQQKPSMKGGDDDMKHNVFDTDEVLTGATLSHDEISAIVNDAKKCGSFKEAFLAHTQTYGIENIDILFPDAKNVTPTPDYIKRDMEWVSTVISGTHHSPFSRIKSTAADITAEEARARGYVKGNKKKEEVISLLKRVTTPTTIYKKQRLDRDDIIDITTLDVVSWLKKEMRMMLDEEIARAILVSDGREADSEDKINEENIRPIWKEDDMYAHHIELANDFKPTDFIESIIRSRKLYKGSGSPTLFITTDTLVDMLLLKDEMGRYLYNTEAELISKLRVSRIVEVPVMENQKRTVGSGATAYETQLLAIYVNLKDYTVGADKGGQISMFDDFDIDYNQYKYLIETRMSGCLIHPKSALVFEKKLPKAAGGSSGGGNTETH